MAHVDLNAVRATIYKYFISNGTAPSVHRLSEMLGYNPADLDFAIRELARSNTLAVAPGKNSIWMAHPFSGTPTAYRVESGGVSYWANCAWDVFGIAAVLGRDTIAHARCAWTHEVLDLSVAAGAPAGDRGVIHLLVPPRNFWENIAFT
jgi:hypothetical protein